MARGSKKQALTALNDFRNAAKSLENQVNKILGQLGIPPGQFAILELLHNQDSQLQTSLAHGLQSTAGNITQVIDKLEKKRLVKRTRLRDDRRKIEVALSKNGKDLMNRVYPVYAAKLGSLMNGFNQQDLKRLKEIAAKFS